MRLDAGSHKVQTGTRFEVSAKLSRPIMERRKIRAADIASQPAASVGGNAWRDLARLTPWRQGERQGERYHSSGNLPLAPLRFAPVRPRFRFSGPAPLEMGTPGVPLWTLSALRPLQHKVLGGAINLGAVNAVLLVEELHHRAL